MNNMDLGTSKEKLNKVYHMVVTAKDMDTGEESVLIDDNYASLFMLNDNVGNESFAEVVVNTNLMEISSKMAQGTKAKMAMLLAHMLTNFTRDEKASHIADLEDIMTNAITEGGIQ